MDVKPGARIENTRSHRRAFVLFSSNTCSSVVVRFDGFAYNSLIVLGESFAILPDEPFRPKAETASNKRQYGDQRACKWCETDIEFHGRDKGWADRGGNYSCNDGKHRHAAEKG